MRRTTLWAGGARILAVGLGVILAVLLGIATTVVAAAPAAPGSTTTVNVSANQAWTDTGLDVKKGDRFSIEASGVIKIASSDPGKTPDGDQNCIASNSFVAPGLHCYTLIAKIDNGEVVEVGSSSAWEVQGSQEANRLYLGVNDETSSFGDNSGSWTAHITVLNSDSLLALLAPVAKGVTLTVIHGYNDPPYNQQNPEACSIATVRDHCANQQFGLDMTPGPGWDKKILAPAPGTPKAFVRGAGGPCLLFTLDDGLNLNICHFDSQRTDLLGKHVERGTVLGTAATSWLHLSLDARPKQCTGGWTNQPSYYCPIEFVSPHTLEGKSLPSDGSANQWKNTSFVSSNNELP
jgi:hypothetical protein